MKRRIVQGPVFAGLNAVTKNPCGLLERESPRVRRGKHGFHPDLLSLIAEQLGHTLGAFDQGEGLLRLAGRVVRHGQIAQSHQLVLRCDALLETLE